MKMKKICLLLSMIAILFSVTACTDGQETVNFEYNDNDIIFSTVMMTGGFRSVDDRTRAYIENEGSEVYKTGLSNFDAAAKECGKLKGFRGCDEDGEKSDEVVDIDLNALQTDENGYQKIYAFLDQLYAQVEEEGDKVIVTITAVYEKRDAEIRFVYEEEPAAVYSDNADPYKVSEITVTPEYTTGEKMVKAGQNTLMGMGTVFAVLIFISLIIAQFEKINRLVTRKTKTGSKDPENVPIPAPPIGDRVPAQVDPMSDTQLVAVITAAVIAASTAAGGSDRLIVRSIRKAKR